MADKQREARRWQVATQVVELLSGARGAEAVRAFSEGCAHDLFDDDEEVREWLTRAIGESNTVRLIRACAQSSCFFCRGGIQACAECDRHGHFEYREICEACLGLGASRCSFCNGSGLSNSDSVPDGLRVPVALERTRLASRRIAELLAELPVEATRVNPSDTMRLQARLILRLNGLLGIIENEIGDARHLHWWTPRSRGWVAETVGGWIEVARDAETRICAAFVAMSETAGLMAAEAADGSNTRSLAEARAAYYRRFRTPDDLDTTCVDHPVLDTILEELGQA